MLQVLGASDQGERDRITSCAALPFLCGHCLLLVDSNYVARFWTQFETWLSIKMGTAAGLVDSPHARFSIELLHDTPDFMASLLINMWTTKDVAEACAVLRGKGVPFSNPEDREVQLDKIIRLDRWLRVHGRTTIPALVPVKPNFRPMPSELV